MNQPMDNVLVVDLTQIYNGPYATFLMAAAGANVIKVEPPGGEPLRRRGVVGGASLPFAMLNASKRSVVIDLKTATGKQALLDLLKNADVLVENFASGTMSRLGLGYDELKLLYPRLIYASSTGFGNDGPYRGYPAMDLTVQAMSGVMSITGFPDRPPVKAGPALCDFFAGIHLYGAIATALFDRERTGTARRVDVSMQDAVYASLSSSLGLAWVADRTKITRTGNRHGGMAEAPYNVYAAADGFVAIVCTTERHWRLLTRLMGAEQYSEDVRFATLKARVQNIDAVDEIVSTWTRSLTKQEIFKLLMEAQIPGAPVRDLHEVMHDENMHARGSLQWQDHPEFGRIVVQNSPMRYGGSSAQSLRPSRSLGADTEEVLRDLTDLADEQIQQITAPKRKD